ncbi:MAG: hypothetical protein V9G20_09430 [Candidatus Promineifilaceae bacterium]
MAGVLTEAQRVWQEFPMSMSLTKWNENNATIFHSYPCFHYPWIFSQETGYSVKAQ